MRKGKGNKRANVRKLLTSKSANVSEQYRAIRKSLKSGLVLVLWIFNFYLFCTHILDSIVQHFNGAPKTIRRVHYFAGKIVNKITTILMVPLFTLFMDGLASRFFPHFLCPVLPHSQFYTIR